MNNDRHKVVDMMGREVEVPQQPKRIVSLVPSQTELLCDLGLEDEVVGITKFCLHPGSWFRKKKRVGGTKTPKLDEVRRLRPDLIIGNKEENDKGSIEKLEKEFPVWMSDIYDFDDALAMIHSIGKLVDRSSASEEIIKKLKGAFSDVPSLGNCLYFIWRDPWMVAGEHVFINSMLEKSGLKNILINHPLLKVKAQNSENTRYPQLNIDDFKELDTDYILLSSEPYPFKEKHIEELQSFFQSSKIILVDGELFSWYGSRLLKSGSYFKKLQEQLN